MTTNKNQTPVIPEGLSGPELMEWLSINATYTKQENYTRILTQDEIATAKSEIVRLEMEQDDINDDFTKVKNDFKGQLNERKLQSKILRQAVRKKAIDEKGEVFVFRVKETCRIIEYTPFGDLIVDRRMTPEEMQTDLFESDGRGNLKITAFKNKKDSDNNENGKAVNL